jgi:type I restriction enzyme S subunit
LPQKIALPGDILLSVRAPVGALNIADRKYGIGRGLCAITPINEVDKKFFWHMMHFIRHQLFILSVGSTYEAVSLDDVKNIEAIIPPLSFQKLIANFLDQKTSQIDTLVSKKQKLIELLQEYRTALISHVVTKGLDPTVPMKDSGVEWLGKIPEHWKIKKLSRIFKNIGSGATPNSDNYSYYEGNIPWVTTSELRDNYIFDTVNRINKKAMKDYSSLKLYPENTLLVAMYGATIGRIGILKIQATVNQACCALIEPQNCLTKYIFYWFLGNRKYIVSLSYGGGQPNISQTLIKELRIPLPTVDEQKQIVIFLDKEIQKIDKVVNKINNSISKLQEYRTALISAAVTGKIDVREEVES